MKSALVIGGTRFFGKRLVTLLLEEGCEVSILTRGRAADPFGARVRRLRADRRDAEAFRRVLGDSRWDVVFDNVCYLPGEAAESCAILDGRVERYIHTSTASVYRQSGMRAESAFDPYSYPVRPSRRGTVDYGEGKRLAEAVFFQSARFPVVAIRLPIVLGPDDYTGRLQFHVERIRRGQAIYVSNTDARTSFVHAQESAEVLLWAARQSFAGPMNACSRGTIAIGELISLVEKALGRSAVIVGHGSAADHTPLIGDQSNVLDNRLATELGFEFWTLDDWLPPLIQELAR